MLNEWASIGLQLSQAIIHLWIHPFYYLAILLLILHYYRQVTFERQCFHARLHSVPIETWNSVIWGLMAGLFASVLFLALGMVIRPFDLLWVWGITLVLSIFRIRYLCMAYAVGIVGILHSVSVWLTIEPLVGFGWYISLQEIHLPSLLALVGLLHLIEAFLVRRQGARAAMPIFIEGKRGKVVGGYQLQRFWPIPLFMWVPMSTESGLMIPGADLLMQWGWPWIAGGIALQTLSIIPFPALVGYGERTISQYPEMQATRAARYLTGYGLFIFLMAWLTEQWSFLAILGALLVIGLHEAMILYLQSKDQSEKPLYVHDHRGLMILAVLPNSAAEEMEIRAGEIIVKVNGQLTLNKEDLHQALQRNPAHCKLEVINRAGHVKFVARSIYHGEHHQLGILLAPDQQARYAMKMETDRWTSALKNVTTINR
jgi:hypothetical protein